MPKKSGNLFNVVFLCVMGTFKQTSTFWPNVWGVFSSALTQDAFPIICIYFIQKCAEVVTKKNYFSL